LNALVIRYKRMINKDRDYSKRLIEWWVSFIQRRPFVVIIVTSLATGAIFFYLLGNFRINTDLNSMISSKLHFRKLEEDFSHAFPQLSDTIVVVLDADTPERAVSARKSLAYRLSKESKLFKTIYEPGGGDFFEKNGLLYLSTEDLENLADKLANAQPLLAFLSQDPSLRGLFSVLGMALSNTEFKEISGGNLNFLFDELSKAFDGVISSHPYQISWETLMLGPEETADQRRQFIILQPYIDIAKLSTDEVSLKTIRRLVKELNLNEKTGVKVHITGDVALSYENLMTVKNSTGIATFISLLLVGIVFYIGLGSGRMVIASLLTLIIGLIWTTGFAIAFVGSLNLISITFAVLFIGLGIDYSIQFCLRYRELVWSGHSEFEGIRTTAKGVGRSLLLCCITVAIGFYSFLPTAYAGVAELGLISGTGMFISFFATITVLPAVLTLSRVKKGRGFSFRFGELLSGFQYKYPKIIVVIAAMLGLGSIPFLPMVYFDSNPLNLYSKTSESVSTIRELFNNTETQPWTISVLVKGEENAQNLAEKLRTLKEVKMAVMLSDFVPEKQSEKLGIISNIALFMPPDIGGLSIKHLDYEQQIKALNSFENTLRKALLLPHMKDNTSAKRLDRSIQHFKGLLTDPVKGKSAFTTLEGSLLFNLPDLFKRLETSLQAKPFNESDLPLQLKEQYVSANRLYRVQVFPSENILNVDALKRFVHAVQALAPNATDAPVTIYESGRAVVSSFKEASLYALIAITVFLLVELRSFYITILILIPLMLAMFLTGAASVLLDIPLNFANVIVVPLLLGIGVHSGIIFMLRYLTEPPLDGNMLRTSTARAVLFSLLTTIISVSSLSLSPHRGIASMGVLLTICLSLLIVCTLVLLPALLALSGRHLKRKKKNNSLKP
jgi:hopanoid biosynthesis associated RND transporter like protein HpnN